MMVGERYFVEVCVGCVAVIDRTLTNPDDNGLHEDTDGVVRYWHGRWVRQKCDCCGQSTSGHWETSEEDRAAAFKLCEELNTTTHAATQQEAK